MQARDVLKLQNIRNTLILNICPLCTFLPWLNTALEPKDFCLYPRDLFYFFREPYQYFLFFFCRVSHFGQHIWRYLYRISKYTIFTLRRCWRTTYLPSPNRMLSHSPHSSWMVDELLGSQKELHSWKMMKIRIHFSFPPLSLADSSHFYHSKYISQESLTTSGLCCAGCCTNAQCVHSFCGKDKKIITSLPQAPPLS